MIEGILPSEAIAVEAREDVLDLVLFPQEVAALGHAVEKRRREFITARACARRALAGLGLPPQPIPSGTRGEPLWPTGVVGSITHCDGYRACALAHASDLLAIGIDAEPNGALPAGILTEIACSEELPGLHSLVAAAPAISWDRLLFSAKESIYKACFSLAGCQLGFKDAVLAFDLARDACKGRPRGAFTGRLSVPGPLVGVGPLMSLEGRWLASEGLLLTAIALRAPFG